MSFKRNEKLRAIALGSRPQGESHRLITLFCEDGSSENCIAHGIRKPGSRLAAALEPASLSRVSLRRSRAEGLASLVEAELLNPFSNLKRQLEGLQTLFEFLSLLQYVCRYGGGDANLFTRALGLLEYANAAPENIECFLPLTRVLALRHLGRMPETAVCIRCHARPPDRVTAAGAFCTPCQEAQGGGYRPLAAELRALLAELEKGIPKGKQAWASLDGLLIWLLEAQDDKTRGKGNDRSGWTERNANR
jgi:DNA repair protein RecO (recombination protein O)